mmetsp:Transcript_13637/g.29023  ORF Transcript_13637/g.29023 Transcript_13637/m.29023 type:complete len:508 (-) Transcript_13637:234-1757(-)
MEQGLGGQRLDVVGLRMTIVGGQIGRGGGAVAGPYLAVGTATANGRYGGGRWLVGDDRDGCRCSVVLGVGVGGAIIVGRCTTTSSSSSTGRRRGLLLLFLLLLLVLLDDDLALLTLLAAAALLLRRLVPTVLLMDRVGRVMLLLPLLVLTIRRRMRRGWVVRSDSSWTVVGRMMMRMTLRISRITLRRRRRRRIAIRPCTTPVVMTWRGRGIGWPSGVVGGVLVVRMRRSMLMSMMMLLMLRGRRGRRRIVRIVVPTIPWSRSRMMSIRMRIRRMIVRSLSCWGIGRSSSSSSLLTSWLSLDRRATGSVAPISGRRRTATAATAAAATVGVGIRIRVGSCRQSRSCCHHVPVLVLATVTITVAFLGGTAAVTIGITIGIGIIASSVGIDLLLLLSSLLVLVLVLVLVLLLLLLEATGAAEADPLLVREALMLDGCGIVAHGRRRRGASRCYRLLRFPRDALLQRGGHYDLGPGGLIKVLFLGLRLLNFPTESFGFGLDIGWMTRMSV